MARQFGSSNPVLGQLGKVTQQSPVFRPGDDRAVDRPMTIDDVVSRTIILVALTGVTAAVAWFTIRGGPWLGIATVGASLAGLVLVLVISFKRVTNPAVIAAYAILQGLLLGVVSRSFERAYPGIVLQAVAATLGVFFGMAALYKLRILRATPRFTRWVMGALVGVVALSLFHWMFSLFGKNLGYVHYGPNSGAGKWAILFSVVCIAVGALTFILDFNQVEQGIRHGMPERYSWYCAFGMLVGLIYLYWQILRLLGYLRQ